MTKVLIVDDESPVREAVKLLGEWDRLGVTKVIEAQDGEEAKRIIVKERPALILSDLQMPRCNGIELMEWVHMEAETAKLIVLTGYDEYSYMRRAIQLGSFDYLLKPIDPDVLNETLARALADVIPDEDDPILQIGAPPTNQRLSLGLFCSEASWPMKMSSGISIDNIASVTTCSSETSGPKS